MLLKRSTLICAQVVADVHELKYRFVARGVEEENVFEEEEEADDVPEVDPERPYIPTSGSPWISKLMSSHDYALMDNEGGGDCLFAVIRDGLGKIGRVLTVAEIRAKLAARQMTRHSRITSLLAMPFALTSRDYPSNLPLCKNHTKHSRREAKRTWT